MPPGQQTKLEGPNSPPRPYSATGKLIGGVALARAGDIVPPVARGVTKGSQAITQGVKSTVAKPGFGDMAYGAGNAAIGVGAVASGNPFAMIYGGGHAMRGVGSIIRGIAKNKAAALEATSPKPGPSYMQPITQGDVPEPPPPTPPPPSYMGPVTKGTPPKPPPPTPSYFSPVTTGPKNPVTMPSSAAPIAPTLPGNVPQQSWAPISPDQPSATAPAAQTYGPIVQDKVPATSLRQPLSSAPSPSSSAATPPTPPINPVHAAYRTALANQAADILHSSKIPSSDLQFMGDDHWNQLEQSVDVARGTPKGESRTDLSDPATRAEILASLRRMEGIPSQSLKVAKQIRDLPGMQ